MWQANWNGVWGHASRSAAGDLHKETPVITNRCHITFSIKVIKWVEIPRGSVIEVRARGCVAQLTAISGEGELCMGNELWSAEFSLIIASKSIMCAPHQIITGPSVFFFFFNLLPRTVCLGKSNSVIYSLNCFFLYLYCVWGFITGQSKTPWRRSSLKSIAICELAEEGKEHQSQVVVSCGVTDTWNKPIFGIYRFYKVFLWAIFRFLFCFVSGKDVYWKQSISFHSDELSVSELFLWNQWLCVVAGNPLLPLRAAPPDFSANRLPSPFLWMKVQVMWLIFLIVQK